jgi:peptide deformylase
MIIPITRYGDLILRRRSRFLKENDINKEVIKLASDMVETMRIAAGIGIAAPQVGVNLHMAIIDMPLIDEKIKEPLIIINPEILEESGEFTMEEGCLSLPEIREEVTRPAIIKVKFMDINGEYKEMQCSGLLTRVFQHEIDHVNGKLFIDHLSPLKRKLLKNQLKKITDGKIDKEIEYALAELSNE